jgi:hypothetical protein
MWRYSIEWGVSDPKDGVLPSQTLEPAVDGHTQEIETGKQGEPQPRSFQEDNNEMGGIGPVPIVASSDETLLHH